MEGSKYLCSNRINKLANWCFDIAIRELEWKWLRPWVNKPTSPWEGVVMYIDAIFFFCNYLSPLANQWCQLFALREPRELALLANSKYKFLSEETLTSSATSTSTLALALTLKLTDDKKVDCNVDRALPKKAVSAEEERRKKWTYSLNKQVDFIFHVVAWPVWAIVIVIVVVVVIVVVP